MLNCVEHWPCEHRAVRVCERRPCEQDTEREYEQDLMGQVTEREPHPSGQCEGERHVVTPSRATRMELRQK